MARAKFREKKKDIVFNFADEVASVPGGRDILKCIQCGTCTSSCAVSEAVPGFGPRKIIAKALLGLKDEVLSSDEIWYCARCQYCIADCKKDIKPGDVIAAIRTIAIKRGYTKTSGARHTLAFLKDLASKGKLDEALLPVRTLKLSSLKLLPYAVRMLARGKVPLPLLKSIKGLDEVKILINDFKD